MRTLTTLLVSFFVIPVAFAQTDTVMLSLEDAQKLVIENNVDAKNSRLNIERAKMQSLEIITTGLPQISGSVNYIYNYKQQKSIIPAGAFSPQELEVTFVNPFQGIASIELQQLLVDGRYFLGLKANKAILSVSEQQERLTEIALKTATKANFINTLVARRANNLLKESYVIVERSLNDIEALFAEGLVEDIEVDSYANAELGIAISTLNMLGKPFYDQLKKNNVSFPKEIEEYLEKKFKILERDRKIKDILKS